MKIHRRSVRIRLVLTGLFLYPLSLACTPTPPSQDALRPPTFYAPRKDDVFVLDEAPLTLSAYETLRIQFPSLRAPEILTLAAYAQVAIRISKRPIDLKTALHLVRPLIFPLPPGGNTQMLTQEWIKNFDAPSPDVLTQKLRATLLALPVRWNEPLLKEIGISTAPWG